MEFNQFAFWLLCGLLGLFAAGIAKFLNDLILEIKGMRIEMAQMNEKLTHVVTNQDWHQKELTRLEKRLNILEEKN
jgi:hypothetical protein